MSEHHLNKLLFDTAGQHKIVDSIADERSQGPHERTARSERGTWRTNALVGGVGVAYKVF